MVKGVLHLHTGQLRKLTLQKEIILYVKNWWQEVRSMLLMNICRLQSNGEFRFCSVSWLLLVFACGEVSA